MIVKIVIHWRYSVMSVRNVDKTLSWKYNLEKLSSANQKVILIYVG